ncbi:anthranilate synthase family protein [Halostreptopolyspora alba]|uniref:anthranilate synthase n=1 Tax=Halostreptopolyspora alba TaxID=2487137 RepID=A0A3N0EFG5_9ACTN|nr:phenazine-specific anthranilate synthase component I [Nocardiopsaceae bacterium YIM 96095]
MTEEPSRGERLLLRAVSGRSPAFALLHRPVTTGDTVDVLVGEVSTRETLGENSSFDERHAETLVVIPYRQIAERGFACVNDETPLLTMRVTERAECPVGRVVSMLPENSIQLSGGHFDVDDDTYAAMVERIRAHEIGQGEGANFVIKRSYIADITDYSPSVALTLFRRLLKRETGAYWTFVVHTGDRTFVGATPERHVSLRDQKAVMNPISGTYRYPQEGPSLQGIMEFLADTKETDELYMVVDEELKMMSRICQSDVRLTGPYLREMSRLAHTEYFITGHCTRDPRGILRETMFAPTVTGSPLANACRVISRYEPAGRGYYSGVIALVGEDERGAHTLDSAILIRTADIDAGGRARIGVGATLVRHSEPASEVTETRSKAAGLLSALDANEVDRLADQPGVNELLRQRNDTISGFWIAGGRQPMAPPPDLAGLRVLVVDAEDSFTAMLEHQLRSLNLTVRVCGVHERVDLDHYDFVVMGPGPGDPRDTDQPRIAHLRSLIQRLLTERRRFLAVCLSHQALGLELGFDLTRRTVPNQGLQREIDLFGVSERVGFYNTFAVRSADSEVVRAGLGTVEVSRDTETGEVHATRGPGFASMQFHAESVLTQNGVSIIRRFAEEILRSGSRYGIPGKSANTRSEVIG